MNKTPLNVFDDASAACAALAKKDSILARALDAIERPHIRRRPGGFEALFRIIVEQQVSVASAQAIWTRCQSGMPELTPRAAIDQGEDGLRSFGLSGPKVRYVTALSQSLETGRLDLASLTPLDDGQALKLLQTIKGIGPWTAAIYLLFCEGRVDIWPAGDVALLGAFCAARRRGGQLEMKEFDARAQKWAPFRGIAAHILWTYYAHIRGRRPI